MVSVYTPDFGFLAGAVTVNVDELVAGFGLKDAVKRAGSPDTLKFTPLVNPPDGVIVTA